MSNRHIEDIPGAELINSRMKAYYDNRPLMWRNLVLILILNLGWAVSFSVVSPLIQLRLNGQGVNDGWLGVISAANSWVYCFAVMYFAWKSDHTVSRFGRRIPYLFISAPVIIISIALFPFVHWVWLLVILALLQMFFTDIKAATIPLLNIDCMPRRLLARTAAPAALVTAALSFFALRYGMKLAELSEVIPFLLGAAILTGTTLVGGFLIKEPPINNPTSEKFKPWSAMKVAWADKTSIVLMISVSLFQSFQISFWSWSWLHAQNSLALSRSETAMAMSWGILVSMVAALPAGWLIDRISPYKILPFLCLLCGVSLGFLFFDPTARGLTVAASMVSLVAALYGASDIMVYRNAHPNDIGSVTSTNSFLRGFYNGCMALVAGLIIQQSGGHYVYAFAVAFAMTALGLVPLYIYRLLLRRKESRLSAGLIDEAGCPIAVKAS